MSRIFYCASIGENRSLEITNACALAFHQHRWYQEAPMLIDETHITEFSFLGPKVFVLAASEAPIEVKYYRELPTISTDVDELIALAKHHSPILRVRAGLLTNHLLETQVVTDVVMEYWEGLKFSELQMPVPDSSYKQINKWELLHCDDERGLKSVVTHLSRV